MKIEEKYNFDFCIHDLIDMKNTVYFVKVVFLHYIYILMIFLILLVPIHNVNIGEYTDQIYWISF